MKSLVGMASIYLLTVSHIATSQPDKDWWACQFVEDAGLNWKDSNWEVTRYTMRKPFVLISDGQGYLTLDSVSKATGTDARFLSCSGLARLINCQSKLTGDTLSFSPVNQSGVVTNAYGALMPDDGERDTLHLRPFECTKG